MKVIEINPNRYTPASETQRAFAQEEIMRRRKEGEKMIKGMFEFIDAQAGFFDFSYRFFPEEPIRTVRIQHGEVCDMPLCLVKHLNNTVKKIRTIGTNLDVDKPTFVTTSRTRFTPMDML
jgi:hypothetical protein